MNLLKMLKALIAKGFATAAEKAEVRRLIKDADQDTQEVAAGDMEKVEALPETEQTGEDIQKQVAALVKAGIEAGTAAVVASFEAKTAALQDDFKKFIKEQQDLREKRSGIYHPDVQEKRKKVNTYLRSFINAQFDNDIETIKTLNGGMSTKELTTDSSGSPYGGYVVDRELSAEIRYLITEYGVARREFFGVQLSKNSYLANTLATDASVYWVDEGAAIKSSQVVLGQSTLTLKKLAVIVTMTRELLEDEEIDLFAFVGERVANLFARAEDLAFFDGDGTGTYGSFTGVLRNTNTNVVNMAATKTAFSDITADNLLDMQDATPSDALPNAKYYMHRTILSYVRKLKDSNNNYIYQEPAGSQPALIWNKPVVLVEAMPDKTATAVSKNFVLFGDLKKAALLGYKGSISADRFNAGVVRNVADNADINLITTDREAIRWVERVGMLVLIPTAVTRLKTAAA